MAIVSLDNVRKEYLLGKTALLALKGISLKVEQGEFIALAGPSGSGKTTVLNIIGCFDKPTSGSVSIEGRPITELSNNQLAQLRADKIGFIFQGFNLLPVLTALENIEYPLLNRNFLPSERLRRAKEALENVGLGNLQNTNPLN